MKIEVSNGEIVDKLTILEIKLNNIKDADKRKNLLAEFDLLNQIITTIIAKDHELYIKLLDVNNKLWMIEDDIRIKEKANEFDEEFIQLARNVYITNDVRAAIKKEINLLTNSMLTEEKSYQSF
jgi:Family of unknown function (DUF6165)